MSSYYRQFSNINDSTSPQDVDAFLYNMLAHRFFIKSGYHITLETWPLKECLKKSSDWTVHSVTNRESNNVVKMHSKLVHPRIDEDDWSIALGQLTKLLRYIRTRNARVTGERERFIYGALNLGSHVRFYELAPYQYNCTAYQNYARTYHVELDDAEIEHILSSLDCKLRDGDLPLRPDEAGQNEVVDPDWLMAKL